MNCTQRQTTDRLYALVSQLLRRRKARVLIEVANDDWFLIAPDVAVDRLVNRHFNSLLSGPLLLVAAFEEMAAHLRGEIELEAHELPGGAMTPARIKAIRAKVASSTKEFERVFGIPARTMESYEQGRRNPDGALRALLRIIDREPAAARRALARF